MSETKMKLEVQSVEVQEPTLEQVEKEAAKQLMTEMFMIQRRIYGIAMNSMLLVQLKQLARGLMTKYHNLDLLKKENIEVKFIRKSNQVEFVPTPHLKELFNQISEELANEAAENIKKERLQEKVNDE